MSLSQVLPLALTLALTTPGAAVAQPSPPTVPAPTRASVPAPMLVGTVVDRASGATVTGATVATGLVETTTGPDGRFELGGVSTGWIDLVIVADGYEPLVERVRPGRPLVLRLTPTGELGGAELVTIEAQLEVEGKAAAYDVNRDVVRTLPGSGNDALKTLQSLPGTARVPFGFGGLVVRGTAPRDTSVFLDGIEVPILYHFGGLASFVPSTMIDSMELISSGYGARYGRSQGGIVELRSRPGRSDRWAAGGEVSLLDASARAEGPAGGGNLSFGLRRSFIDAVLAAVPTSDLTIAPRYLDAQARWQSRSGKLTALLFGADDGINLDASTSQIAIRQSFVRAGLRYADRRGDLDVAVVPWIGFDRTAVMADKNSTVRSNVTVATRATVQRDVAHGFVAAGLDLQGNRYGYLLDADVPKVAPGMMPFPARAEGARWAADLGGWAEWAHRFADDKFVIQPGLRGDRFGLTGQWVLDPRITLRQQATSMVTLTQSFGRYHQPALATALDYQLPGQPIKASYAWQASAGISVVSTALGGDVSATAFGAALRDLPVDVVTGATPYAAPGSPGSGGAVSALRDFNEKALGRWTPQASRGRGRTYGIEAMVRRRVGQLQGWIAYTYARSYRQGDPWALDRYAPYVLDQPHVLTALVTAPLGARWRLGARLRFASGNPITPTVGSFFDTSAQTFQPLSGPALSDRLPPFIQLDLRIDRSWQRPWGTLKLFLDVQNVSNRVNAEGVSYNFDYSARQYTRGLPVFPSLGLEYSP